MTRSLVRITALILALLCCTHGASVWAQTPLPDALPTASSPHESEEPIERLARPYFDIARREALAHGLELALVLGVIEVESHFNAHAISHAGARGLMQLMSGVEHDFGVTDVFDPDENVRAGCAYLALLLRRFEGRLDWALAAYNAGPARVRAAKGPPSLTYVKRVLRARARWRRRLGLAGSPALDLPPQ